MSRSSRRRACLRVALLPVLLALSLSARGAVIPAEEASKHVGETTAVRGYVAVVFVSKSGTTFINFGKPYPDQVFTAVIFKSAAGRFPDPFGWQGKTITVSGKIKLYRGKPEVVLDALSQVSE